MRTMNEYQRTTRDFAYFGDSGEYLMAAATANVADIVTRANFEAFKRALPEGSYVVEGFKGPLSGCYGEWLLIDPTRQDAIDIAEDIFDALKEYPVVDDEVLSELENDEALEAAAAACDIGGSGSETREAAAPFILDKSEERDRGPAYCGVEDYWPSERDVFFGYLAWRRSIKGRECEFGITC